MQKNTVIGKLGFYIFNWWAHASREYIHSETPRRLLGVVKFYSFLQTTAINSDTLNPPKRRYTWLNRAKVLWNERVGGKRERHRLTNVPIRRHRFIKGASMVVAPQAGIVYVMLLAHCQYIIMCHWRHKLETKRLLIILIVLYIMYLRDCYKFYVLSIAKTVSFWNGNWNIHYSLY